MKYARTLPSGKKETWPQAVGRVASHVASAEDYESNKLQYTAEFTKIMLERAFLPGGRILSNAGTNILNLMNCFVLPIEDTKESIYNTLSKAAQIFAWGGGIGYNFSNLRAKGSELKTTGGEASGPLSFMELFDLTGEVISQASRRGAQMGILNIDHPDIETFIEYKNKLNSRNSRVFNEIIEKQSNAKYSEHVYKVLANNQLTHFNISVGITDEYMRSGDTKILQMIASNAWNNGDPGVFFIDTANKDNLAPYLGRLDATNPCGEVPLLPYEPCCLGSINLTRFIERGYIDFEYLEEVVRLAVRFLDNVHDISHTMIPEIDTAARATRRLGLGVMGFADVLAEMAIPYDSDDAYTMAKVFGRFISYYSWRESMDLAQEKGPFPAFIDERINWRLIDRVGLTRKPVRNIAVTSIAPTGSIALIADCNSGIEPYFARSYVRNITHGIGNFAKSTLEQKLHDNNIKVAHEIRWKDHVKMQGIWQDYTDNAVSKTINMPNNATIDDIIRAYEYAWEEKLKGITIYRDGSRAFQILNSED